MCADREAGRDESLRVMTAMRGTQRLEVTERQLRRLQALALEERWSWRDADGVDLLGEYLEHTFDRLIAEQKLVRVTDRGGAFWAFNTGLVDAAFADVYGACVPASEEPADGDIPSEWKVRAFCVAGSSRYGRQLVRELGTELPRPAAYIAGGAWQEGPHGDFDVDYEALCEQREKVSPHTLDQVGAADSEGFEAILRVAVETAKARLRRFPRCALPAWGAPVGLDGLVWCVPMSLVDPGSVDAVLALQEVPGRGDTQDDSAARYAAQAMLGVEEAYLAIRIVGPTDGGMGWAARAILANADAADEKDDAERDADDEWPMGQQVPAAALTADESFIGADTASTQQPVITQVPPREAQRARLTCSDRRVPTYLVRPGDTVGILRRKDVEPPHIVLPSRHGFQGVSQIQGRFVVAEDTRWEFVHEGSNWTMVCHGDGSEKVLCERGAREYLQMGDRIVFSGSPAFTLGR